MAMEAGDVRFSIGRVIGDSFGVYGRNFVGFTVLALVIGLVNLAYAVFYANDATVAALTTGQFDYSGLGMAMIINLFAGGLTQATIIYGTFQDLRGHKAGVGDCIARGLAAVISVAIANVIFAIALSIGFVLLIIPGIIIMVMWWVYVAAIVVERKGIFESFGRSGELTKGHRWGILGLMLVVLVLGMIVGVVAKLIAGVGIIGIPTADSILTLSIVNYVLYSVVAAFGAVVTTVSYYYLRAEKEGVGIEDIAGVFD